MSLWCPGVLPCWAKLGLAWSLGRAVALNLNLNLNPEFFHSEMFCWRLEPPWEARGWELTPCSSAHAVVIKARPFLDPEIME